MPYSQLCRVSQGLKLPEKRQSSSHASVCRLSMQATQGDNTAERPLWAEKGGLDFDGRAKWDAWTAVKGMKPPKAKLNFVKV